MSETLLYARVVGTDDAEWRAVYRWAGLRESHMDLDAQTGADARDELADHLCVDRQEVEVCYE